MKKVAEMAWDRADGGRYRVAFLGNVRTAICVSVFIRSYTMLKDWRRRL